MCRKPKTVQRRPTLSNLAVSLIKYYVGGIIIFNKTGNVSIIIAKRRGNPKIPLFINGTAINIL